MSSPSKTGEIRKEIRNLDPQIIIPFVRLLEAYVEEWKEEIINVQKDELLSLQGSIRRVRMIIKDLTRPTVEPKKTGTYID